MTRDHALELVGVAAATAAVASVVGALALYALRRRSIGAQAVVVALSAVGAVAIGVRVASHRMLVSNDDVAVLDVALASAGAVAVTTALLLGRRVGRAGASLIAMARHVGDDDAGSCSPADAPRELSRLARELDDTAMRLQQARARERELEDARRELVAWVSHDLRTPLAGIRAIAEALHDGVITDEETTRRYLRTLCDEAEHLGRLVEDLFELSRAQAGGFQLDFERVALGDLVSDALAGARPVAAAKGVRILSSVSTSSVEVRASAKEFLRVLRNVLENAIRHTAAGGTVQVDVSAVAGRGRVSVLDSGGGIPPGELPRVFDVAFRGDPARGGRNGAGLGLAIARSLVEAHHGDISVCNENGGARFTIALPLARSAHVPLR